MFPWKGKELKDNIKIGIERKKLLSKKLTDLWMKATNKHTEV